MLSMKTIHNKLKEYRLKAGMTQEDVVAILGLQSTNRLSRWENGKAYPSVVNLLKLAQLYKVNSEALYTLI